MAEAINILCALTNAVCAILLLRAYRRSRLRLLFWTGLAFGTLAVSNMLVYADIFVFTGTDLSALRVAPTVAGLALLCYGLIWESA